MKICDKRKDTENIWQKSEKKKQVKMYKKILEKAASAGTVALLGYEIGTHTVNDAPTEKIADNHNTNILIFAVFVLICILLAFIGKIMLKKRPLV